MPVDSYTLTDASPTSASHDVDVDDPIITIEDLQEKDSVAVHIEIDGTTTPTTSSPIAHIARSNGPVKLDISSGHKVLLHLTPFMPDSSRSVTGKIESA